MQNLWSPRNAVHKLPDCSVLWEAASKSGLEKPQDRLQGQNESCGVIITTQPAKGFIHSTLSARILQGVWSL